MMSRNLTLLILALISLTVPLSLSAGPPKRQKQKGVSSKEAKTASKKRHEVAVKLNGLKSKMHNVKVKLNDASAKADRVTESLSDVRGRIDRAQSKLARTQSRISLLEARHDNTVERLQATTERLKERRRLLSVRVKENYERGQITYAQVLLQSRSVQDLMSRGHYVRHIVQSDAKLIDSVKQDMKRIEQDKRDLEAQQREQQELAGQYEAQKEEWLQEKSRQQQILKVTQSQRSQAQDELDDIAGEAEAMSERIRQLSEVIRRRREAEAREAVAFRHRRNAANRAHAAEARRRARANAPNPSRKSRRVQEPLPPPEEDEPDNAPLPSMGTGSFRRPVDGPITSNFGYRYHPILHRRKLHAGTDFGVHTGTPIHAADSGIVILSGHSGGYGNCVILDHGRGLTTLYGHCSRLVVSEGQTVRKGDVIAYSGSTGLSTGPHLHWEVRRNGTPIHP